MDPESSSNEDAFMDYYVDYGNEFFEGTRAYRSFAAVCFSLVFCISVPANSFLLWVLLKKRAWKTTPDLLLLQLTISHLCFTVTQPFDASHALQGWIFGDFLCCVTNGVFVFGLYSYIWIITAMMLHHYVDVVPVSCVSALPTKRNVIIASVVIWVVSAAVGIEVAMNSEVIGYSFGEDCFHHGDFHWLLFDIYLQVSVFFVIPFIIMTICCIHMLITVKQSGLNRHGQTLKLTLGLIVIFFLCLAPYNISHFIVSLAMLDVFEITGHGFYKAHMIITSLLSLHCCLSPLLHMFGAQRFRKHLPLLCFPSFLRGDESHEISLVPAMSTNDESA